MERFSPVFEVIGVMGLLTCGCFVAEGCTSSPAKPTCTQNSSCEAGSVCLNGNCRQLCNQTNECGLGSTCSSGVCTACQGACNEPVIAGITGNNDSDPTKVADGLVISGSNLDSATFSLSTATEKHVLAVRSQSMTSAEVVLWPDVLAGPYTLTATNQSGTVTANVTLTLPDLGGDAVLNRLNGMASGQLGIQLLPVGTTAGTVAAGNDPRFLPAPGAPGRILYDNGSAWIALPPGAAGRVLTAGPNWGLPLSPTKSAPFNDWTYVSCASCVYRYTASPILTITPMASGIVNLAVNFRYNFSMTEHSHLMFGLHVSTSSSQPSCSTAFTLTGGGAGFVSTTPVVGGNELEVAFVVPYNVSAGATYHIWLGSYAGSNFDCAGQPNAAFGYGAITATLHQAAGL